MARPPSLEDVLAGQRTGRARSRRKARKLRGPSRIQRLAAAPREPRASVLQFLRLQRSLLGDIQDLVERELVPALPEVVQVEARPLESLPDSADAQVGIRLDAAPCGVCGPLPAWYAQALLGTPVRRVDAIGGRLGAILAGLEVAITERVAEVGPLLEGVARSIWNHNRAEMSRVLQIDLRRREAGLADFIQEFTRKNVALIQSVAQSQLARMEATVARATAGQVRVETLRDEIMGTFNVSKARAALIARDQTLKSNSDLSQLRQQQAGVREYIWTTSRDERVRGNPSGKWAKSQSNHFALDGTRQSWLVAPVTNPVTGARNHPGQDYQCRCTAIPIVDDLLGGPLEETAQEETPQAPPPREPPPPPPGPMPPLDLLDLVMAIPSRELAVFRAAYKGATPAEVDAIATGLELPKNSRVNRFAPIQVEVGPDGKAILTDGNHRLASAREAGATRIRARVRTYQANGRYTEREVILPIGRGGVDLSRQALR